MSEPVSILPSNATPLERALEAGVAAAEPDLRAIAALMDPARCPAHLLGWLAWAMSVEVWDDAWPEEEKRATIAASVGVHRRKGTRAAIRHALRAAGFGEVSIREGSYARTLDGSWILDGSVDLGATTYFAEPWYLDGSVTLDGSRLLGAEDQWAAYRIILTRPISAGQAAQIRAILENVAPVRCHLKSLVFTEAARLLDGSWLLDGSLTLGAA